MMVNHMGETIALSKLIAHYRRMGRNNHAMAAFWRLRTRVVIAEYREQRDAPAEQRRAA